MDRATLRTAFLDRYVLASFLFVLCVYFVPPVLTGRQLLFESWAAPVWQLAIDTGAGFGCGSLSCVPLFLFVFLAYTYLLAVVLAGGVREARRLAA